MDGRASARIRRGFSGVVEFCLDPGGYGLILTLGRTLSARRRHRARTQLPRDVLPDLGLIRVHRQAREIDMLERQPTRDPHVVVADHAVVAEHRTFGGYRG